MSIHFDRTKKRWRYSFNRVLNGERQRTTKLLPAGWSRAQADAYDREETAKWFAVASGIERPKPSINEAVELYCVERCPQLKHGDNQIRELALIYWAYDGKSIDQLAEVSKHYSDTEAGRISPATIRNRLAYLRAACRYAFKYHGLGEHDPSERMQMPTVRNERHVYITRKEMLAIARKCNRIDVRAFIRVAFYSGMRLGEITRARVHNGSFLLEDTKNGDRRAIPIHPKLGTALKYLPPRISKIAIQKHWEKARNAAKFAHVHFHDLRHSAASEMINNGFDLYIVGAVLSRPSNESLNALAAGALYSFGFSKPLLSNSASFGPLPHCDASFW